MIYGKTHSKSLKNDKIQNINVSDISYHLKILFPRFIKIGLCSFDLNDDNTAKKFTFKYTIKTQEQFNENPMLIDSVINSQKHFIFNRIISTDINYIVK